MLFISVALGLIVGGIVFFQQATIGSQTSKFTRIISAMAAEAQAMRQNSAAALAPGTDLVALLDAAGAIPTSYVAVPGLGGNAMILSPWGEGIPVVTAVNSTTGFPVIRIESQQMPTGVCTRVTSFDSGGNGVLGVSYHAVVFQRGFGSGSTRATLGVWSGAHTTSQAASSCGDANLSLVEIQFSWQP